MYLVCFFRVSGTFLGKFILGPITVEFRQVATCRMSAALHHGLFFLSTSPIICRAICPLVSSRDNLRFVYKGFDLPFTFVYESCLAIATPRERVGQACKTTGRWYVLHKLRVLAWMALIVWAAVPGLWRAFGQEKNMDVSTFGVVGGLLLVVVIVLALAGKTLGTGKEDAAMSNVGRRVLIGYLLLLGLSLALLLAALGTIDFPETPADVGEGLPAGVPAEVAGFPTLLRVLPSSTLGSTPSIRLMLYGKNFDDAPKVRFNNSLSDREIKVIDPHVLLQVTLEQKDLVSQGSITVEVVNTGNKISNAIVVGVNKPTACVRLFFCGRCFRITRELQLLLLVIVAGALGSFLHALRSVLDFIGNRTLVASWFWWYAARPFIGMAMALIFYAVLRGGFLAGTPADAKAVSPFGVVAIGALVGMFSDKAALKLAEIFDTLFKTPESRSDKLAAATVANLDPDKVTVGTTPPPDLAIIGDHLAKVTGVLFDGVERKPKISPTAKQVTVALTPTDVATVRDIVITLIDPDSGKVSAGTLHIVKPGSSGQNVASAGGTGGSGANAPAATGSGSGNAPAASPSAGGG
jgi:hypothetical protein